MFGRKALVSSVLVLGCIASALGDVSELSGSPAFVQNYGQIKNVDTFIDDVVKYYSNLGGESGQSQGQSQGHSKTGQSLDTRFGVNNGNNQGVSQQGQGGSSDSGISNFLKGYGPIRDIDTFINAVVQYHNSQDGGSSQSVSQSNSISSGAGNNFRTNQGISSHQVSSHGNTHSHSQQNFGGSQGDSSASGVANFLKSYGRINDIDTFINAIVQYHSNEDGGSIQQSGNARSDSVGAYQQSVQSQQSYNVQQGPSGVTQTSSFKSVGDHGTIQTHSSTYQSHSGQSQSHQSQVSQTFQSRSGGSNGGNAADFVKSYGQISNVDEFINAVVQHYNNVNE